MEPNALDRLGVA